MKILVTALNEQHFALNWTIFVFVPKTSFPCRLPSCKFPILHGITNSFLLGEEKESNWICYKLVCHPLINYEECCTWLDHHQYWEKPTIDNFCVWLASFEVINFHTHSRDDAASCWTRESPFGQLVRVSLGCSTGLVWLLELRLLSLFFFLSRTKHSSRVKSSFVFKDSSDVECR